MAWEDDPISYGTNSSGQTTRVGTINGQSVNDTLVNNTGQWPGFQGAYQWVPNAPASSATAPPSPPIAAVPPHLQFSATTVGTTVMLAWGRCRLPGQIIWAAGIDAVNSTLDTSLLTFAAAYCEPMDPSQAVTIQTMSANGTVFYDAAQGGVIEVANLSGDDQATLQNCINTMAVYTGGETQLPDPTIEAYVGVGNVPAYRGLRYIVFQDFPLAIANNSVPNIVVEWRPVSGGPLFNVSDAMTSLIEHVNLRSELGPIFAVPTISGIDDLCYGLVITSSDSLISHFQSHKAIYSYQIVESDPIKIVRREVNADLVIDLTVDEADIKSENNAPAITFRRVNLTQMPVGLDFSYLDPDQEFDTKVAPSRYDGSAPGNATGNPSGISSMSSAYIIDATSARTLAYSMLFQMRSFAGKANFEIADLRPEASDVVEVVSTEGDQYVILVDGQSVTKNRTNAISGKLLLTAAGADINGDGGRDGGSSTGRKYWPENVLTVDFAVSSASNKVWSMGDNNSYVMGMNSLSAPTRRISSTRWRDVAAQDPSGLGWGGDDFYSGNGGLGGLFQDDFYVYWIHRTTLVISRLLKTASNINTVQTLTIPEGFYVDGVFGHDNQNVAGNQCSVFRDGKLYIAWNGRWNGVGSGSGSDSFKLIVVDIEAWSASAVTAYDYFVYAGSDQHFPMSIGMADNGTIVIATNTGFSPFAGKYYYANISDLTSWSSLAATFPFSTRNWQAPNIGDKLYFAEAQNQGHVGEANRKTRVAVVDVSGSLSESVVDLNVKDANFLGFSQIGHITMWASPTHLFVYGNHTNALSSSPVGGPPFEHRYIGRFDASTLDAAGGKFLSELVYNENDFELATGRYFDGKVYCAMLAYNATRTSFLSMDEDLTAPNLHWTTDTTTPVNDDFAAASLIFVNETQTGDLTYGSTEDDEPVPGYATTGDYIFGFNNGHSVWYRFTAPTTDTYTIAAEQTGHYKNPGIAVYTGSTLAGLSYETGSLGSGGIASCDLTATAGITYFISVAVYPGSTDAFGGALLIRPIHEGRYTIGITGP